jgi:hypothetical protein
MDSFTDLKCIIQPFQKANGIAYFIEVPQKWSQYFKSTHSDQMEQSKIKMKIVLIPTFN